jgi:hypothetical protein
MKTTSIFGIIFFTYISLLFQGCCSSASDDGYLFNDGIKNANYMIAVDSSNKIINISYLGSSNKLYPDKNFCCFSISNAKDFTTLIIETIGKIDTVTFKTTVIQLQHSYDANCEKESMSLSRTAPIIDYSTCDSINLITSDYTYNPTIVYKIWP